MKTPVTFDDAELSSDPRQPAFYPRLDDLIAFARRFADDTDFTSASSAEMPTHKRVDVEFEIMPGRQAGMLKNVDSQAFFSALAVTRIAPPLTLTCHVRFAVPDEDSIQSVMMHEMVHVYRASGLFEQVEWDGLVDCGRRNLVLERPISKFLQAAGCNVADDMWAPATLGHFYAEKLAGRELFQELMDQESVAHLLELVRWRAYPASEVTAAQEMLGKILAGEIANRPGALRDGSLMGTVSRVDPA